MPNTNPPITNVRNLLLEYELAQKGAKCDYAFYLAATADNAEDLASIAKNNRVLALKMYLNNTFGELCLSKVTDWIKHFESWSKNFPICVHAEQQTTAAVILLANLYQRSIHICHVAREEEILIIKAAKEKGINVTCEVSPHHLFLSQEDLQTIGPERGSVKPSLVSLRDQKALWENINIIDVFASDHAPHLYSEKVGQNSPPGFPGLETMLPLLLTAVKEGRLTINDLWKKLYYNPKRIFNLPDQENTYIEVDIDEEWIIPNAMPFSKAGWTPFAGKKVVGRVRRVVLRNEVAFVDGQVLVSPGYGLNVLKFQEFPITTNQAISQDSINLNIIDFEKVEINHNESRKQQTNKLYSEMLRELGIQYQTPKPLSVAITPSSSVKVISSPIALGYGLVGKHILSVETFNREQLHELFNLAHKFRLCVAKEKPIDRGNEQIPIENILKGKIMASMFYEVSTRTSCSFAAAMQRLGGAVIYMNEETSSVKKGESLEDSVTIMANYSDVVVLRHPRKGAVAKAAQICLKPVINAGDGVGEHPSQALLDVFTIREEIGTVNNLVVKLAINQILKN
jgi:carbamoyl-phosphate synthase/aspartate carbamoyltransferase/dihydroorotase